MSGKLFPMEHLIRCREDVVAARNLLANVWTSYGYQISELVLTLDEPGRDASGRQRRKIHAWFDELAHHTGHTPPEMKDWLLWEFLEPVEVDVRGKVHVRRRSWTELSKDEASTLMDRIQAWAATELGVELV